MSLKKKFKYPVILYFLKRINIAADVRQRFKSQVRHQNENMKIFLRRNPPGRLLTKNPRSKIAMEKFLKTLSFGIEFKL